MMKKTLYCEKGCKGTFEVAFKVKARKTRKMIVVDEDITPLQWDRDNTGLVILCPLCLAKGRNWWTTALTEQEEEKLLE